MELFNKVELRLNRPDFKHNPEFALIDSILETNQHLIKMLQPDITAGTKTSKFGRKDTPSVEQIVRFALFKEIRNLNYEDLTLSQTDSKICETFVGLNCRRPFSESVLHKYISRIQPESLHAFFQELNKIALSEGYEDLEKMRTDTSVVKNYIHYPTNNSLVWDCIHESHRLLKHLKDEHDDIHYRSYTKGAKEQYYKLNNINKGHKWEQEFKKQLTTFTKSIRQVNRIISQKKSLPLTSKGIGLMYALEELVPLMNRIYDVAYRGEIIKEKVPNEEKLFSIYEPHTDIIVKGSREVEFGHKVQLTSGKSNLIMDCEVLDGNPNDSTLFQQSINRLEDMYGIIPRDAAVDGGYYSQANAEFAQEKGLLNLAFNKIKECWHLTTSKMMKTVLDKWRSGKEAIISNLKRGQRISRNNWCGRNGFEAKVLWSVIGYNIRMMTRQMVRQLAPQLG